MSTGKPALPRILIVDDDKSIINFLRATLEDHFEIVGSSNDGLSGVETARRLKPDVIVAELLLPRLNGIEMAQSLGRRDSRPAIVYLTNVEDPEWIDAAMATGAAAFVFKRFVARDLLIAIESAMLGRTFISPADL